VNVYVESNYILELAFWQEQHGDSLAILQYAESSRVRLVIPAYCIGECLERLARRRIQRQNVQANLREEVRELSRSAPSAFLSDQLRGFTEALVLTSDQDWKRYNEALARLLRTADFIPFTQTIIVRGEELRKRLDLSHQDSLIMASVVGHLETTGPDQAVFLNKNKKDFENPDVRADLKALRCDLKTDFRSGLAFIEASLRER
jgi:predicted nucleic acid-binding protein